MLQFKTQKDIISLLEYMQKHGVVPTKAHLTEIQWKMVVNPETTLSTLDGTQDNFYTVEYNSQFSVTIFMAGDPETAIRACYMDAVNREMFHLFYNLINSRAISVEIPGNNGTTPTTEDNIEGTQIDILIQYLLTKIHDAHGTQLHLLPVETA